jgi:hypothetical protein
MVQGQPGHIICEAPISKKPEQNGLGRVAQAVEHLLCMCETLSSNSSPTKKKENTREAGYAHAYL